MRIPYNDHACIKMSKIKIDAIYNDNNNNNETYLNIKITNLIPRAFPYAAPTT